MECYQTTDFFRHFGSLLIRRAHCHRRPARLRYRHIGRWQWGIINNTFTILSWRLNVQRVVHIYLRRVWWRVCVAPGSSSNQRAYRDEGTTLSAGRRWRYLLRGLRWGDRWALRLSLYICKLSLCGHIPKVWWVSVWLGHAWDVPRPLLRCGMASRTCWPTIFRK